jgi:NAD(P)-dependent dehydrogenase (short-subunit alcohol dehydrogenase family)
MNTHSLLENQVAIVTGAGRGIGRAIALALAQAGAAVVLAARSESEIASVRDEIKQNGGQALAIPTDVSDMSQVDHLLVLTLRAFKRVDVLVNNAAVIQPFGHVWETSPTAWQKAMDINIVGPYLCTRTVLPHMLDRGSGRIINISSGAAESNIEGASAYCASKAAFERFSSILAIEVEGRGVVVTVFRPGIVDTPMQTEIRDTSERHLPKVDRWRNWHEQSQLRPPSEPAQAVLWLASQFADHENGQLFSIDDDRFRRRIAADLGTAAMSGRERTK